MTKPPVSLIRCGMLLACFAATLAAQETGGQPGFRFAAVTDQSLGLWDGEQAVLVYNHGPITPPGAASGRGRSCYFHPVYGLDGEVLTDDFPRDHTYHRGLYFAWPHIKLGETEYETWTARGDLKQEFRRFTTQQARAGTAKLGIENAWTIAGRPLVREEILVEVHPAADSARSIDIAATWTPLEQPLTLSGAEGKSYGGLNFRFAPQARPTITIPPAAAPPAGSSVTEGRVNEDLLVTRLAWADFAGLFPGSKNASGAAIFVPPSHPDFPPTWMTRHYGLMSVGWPGVEPQTFPVGQPFSCRYRIWIHRGQVSQRTIESAYAAWRKQP